MSGNLGSRTLLLLLNWGILRCSSGTTSGSTAGSGCATARTDVQEQVLNILSLKGLIGHEHRGPDRLDIGNLGGGDQSLKLLGL
jgi:hypothetical protein